MSSIFGGSKSQSNSTYGNQAYGNISSAFSPIEGMANTGANALSSLLSGDTSGLNAFKNATGFNAVTQQGSQGITGNQAASGLLRSGSTGTALQNYGQTEQNQYTQNYINDLLSQAGLGFNAGQLISGAGTQGSTNSTSSSKPGLGGLLGGVGSLIAAGHGG